MRWGSTTRAVNSRRISLQVSGISTAVMGWSVYSVAAITASRAGAVIANRVQRCQEVQQRTWCSSRPARPLAVWAEGLLDGPAAAGDADRFAQRHDVPQRPDVRGVAAVERHLPCGAVAA